MYYSENAKKQENLRIHWKTQKLGAETSGVRAFALSRLPFCLLYHKHFNTPVCKRNTEKSQINFREVCWKNIILFESKDSRFHKKGGEKDCSENFCGWFQRRKKEELWKMYVLRLGSRFACIVCSRFVF